MSIKDCLLEVKNAAKDFLSNEDANELLLNIKNKLELKKGAKKIEAIEEKISKEVLNDIKITKKIELLNKLRDKEKILELYKYIDEVWSDNPMKGIKALLVGLQESRRGVRDSVDGSIVDYKNKYISGFFNTLERFDLLETFNQRALHKEIIQEVMDNPFISTSAADKAKLKKAGIPLPEDKPLYANKDAYKIAKTIKEWNEIVVKDKNNLGSWVSMLPGYVFRQSHLVEKMLKAGGESIKDEV